MARSRRAGRGEGSIYQRKDGRWVASFLPEGEAKRKYFYDKTRKDVYDQLQNALLAQKQGTLATGPQQSVKQFLEYWLEDVHKTKIRIGTYEGYRIVLDKYLLPGLGHIRLQKLTAQQVQSFYSKKMKEGLSAKRIKAIHMILSKALDHAKRLRLVANNVCDDVELPISRQREIEPLNPMQCQVLLQKVQEHKLEALLTLAVTTGMRKGEMLSLQWSDVDLQKGALKIKRTVSYIAHHGFVVGEPKTPKSKREIELPQFVVDKLKHHRAALLEARLKDGVQWIDNDLVFPNKHGGFLVPTTLFNHFSKLLEDAGLPHIRFHDLRHSAATLLLSMGVPMKVVQQILGHSNYATTANVYSHVLPEMQQDAMQKMDNHFRQQSQ